MIRMKKIRRMTANIFRDIRFPAGDYNIANTHQLKAGSHKFAGLSFYSITIKFAKNFGKE
jgi:hypothetical protein